ncbi:MAG: FAD-binding oxidoreductase [Bacillota bacterium]
MEVHGFNEDMARMFELTTRRAEAISRAPAALDSTDPINGLVRRLHAAEIRLVLKVVTEETSTTRTYRFEPAPRSSGLPLFRAGQYLSLKVSVNGVKITRPYSLSAAPFEARSFYELTIRRKDGGFLTEYIWKNWREGIVVEASGPHGTFYHDPLRDSGTVVALAGGSGITPFRSMIREIAAGQSGVNMILIYGSRCADDIIFKNELDLLAAQAPQKIRVIHVLSEPDNEWQGRTGFIDAALIREETGSVNGKSFFICGPPVMYTFCTDQLSSLAVPPRLIRRELAGSVDDISADPGFPAAVKGKQFTIRVRYRGKSMILPAAATETVLTALEKGSLEPESQCRSGECGFCRALVLSGEVFFRPEGDGRRAADRKCGFFHPCSSYPLTDLELLIP